MNCEGFEQWLNTYESSRARDGKLSPGALRDAVSRCKRVERALGVDLDSEIRRGGSADDLVARMGKSVTRFKIKGYEERGLASLVRAVRLYAEYRGAK